MRHVPEALVLFLIHVMVAGLGLPLVKASQLPMSMFGWDGSCFHFASPRRLACSFCGLIALSDSSRILWVGPSVRYALHYLSNSEFGRSRRRLHDRDGQRRGES
jgi:hypothetical protein